VSRISEVAEVEENCGKGFITGRGDASGDDEKELMISELITQLFERGR
jgi:hypothetical protein